VMYDTTAKVPLLPRRTSTGVNPGFPTSCASASSRPESPKKLPGCVPLLLLLPWLLGTA
jgi:hypothetical protein